MRSDKDNTEHIRSGEDNIEHIRSGEDNIEHIRSDKDNTKHERLGQDITEVRLRRESDDEALYRLWQHAFGDSDEFTDYYFSTYMKENRVLVFTDQGQLMAALNENPYEIVMNGQHFAGCYIVGVATFMEYRHRGAMTALIKRSMEEAYDRELPFMYLMPADPDIYRPFQFAYIYAQEIEKLHMDADGSRRAGLLSGLFSKKDDKKENFIYARAAVDDADRQAVADMANEVLEAECSVYTHRDAHYFWRLQLENQVSGGELLMIYNDDRLIGYVSYASEKVVEIREAYCISYMKESMRSWLAGFLKETVGDKECYVLPLSMGGFLEGRYLGERYMRPIIMGRIIKLESFIRLMPKKRKFFEIRMHVEDELIPANNGIFLWRYDEMGHHLIRKDDTQADIVLEIAILIQWLMGYSHIKELTEGGWIKVNTDCERLLYNIPVCGSILINEII